MNGADDDSAAAPMDVEHMLVQCAFTLQLGDVVVEGGVICRVREMRCGPAGASSYRHWSMRVLVSGSCESA
jgi:hypothetical protein